MNPDRSFKAYAAQSPMIEGLRMSYRGRMRMINTFAALLSGGWALSVFVTG